MRLEGALLQPVAHRTRLRCALAVGRPGRSVPVEAVDLSLLPDAAVAAAGWDAQRRRGMRLVLPDARLQEAVDAGRAALLLASDARSRPSGEVVAALEDWGFDGEAAALDEATADLGARWEMLDTGVTVKLYPDARHETLNETNRDEVTADLIGWLDKILS